MKKKRLISSILLLALTGIMLTGCSPLDKVKDVIKPKEEAPKDYSVKIKGETCPTSYTQDELISGNYYVVHNNKYYILPSYKTNSEEGIAEYDTADLNFHAFFDLKNEDEIPTLYVSNGDKLIYYSENTLLDNVLFARFKDEGYTIAAYDYKSMSNGNIYFDIENSDNGLDDFVVLDTDFYKQIQDMDLKHNIFIDRVSKTKVNSDYIDNGILVGLEPNKEYNLQMYEGTIYHNLKVTSEIHAFSNMEKFKTCEYTPLKAENQYEVTIPKYLKNGYYDIDGIGMIRLMMTGNSYVLDDYDSFNDPILEQKEDVDGTIIMPSVYSETESLNQYKSETPGALGYVDPESNSTSTDSTKTDTKKPSIGQTNTKYFKVTANDTSGTIYVNSDETDGNVILYTNTGKKTYAEYKTDAKRYEITLNDKDIKDTKEFVIATSGFAEKFEMSTPEGWKIENTTRDKVKDFVNNTSSKGENER